MKIIDKTNYFTQYRTLYSGCFDIHAAKNVQIAPGRREIIPTGLYLQMEESDYSPEYIYVLSICPRSSLSIKSIDCIPSEIDIDYQQEIHVILVNNSSFNYQIKIGEYIAQGRFSRSYRSLGNIEIKKLRRVGGFGSTNFVREN